MDPGRTARSTAAAPHRMTKHSRSYSWLPLNRPRSSPVPPPWAVPFRSAATPVAGRCPTPAPVPDPCPPACEPGALASFACSPVGSGEWGGFEVLCAVGVAGGASEAAAAAAATAAAGDANAPTAPAELPLGRWARGAVEEGPERSGVSGGWSWVWEGPLGVGPPSRDGRCGAEAEVERGGGLRRRAGSSREAASCPSAARQRRGSSVKTPWVRSGEGRKGCVRAGKRD